jgi:hypothetical protein
MYLEREGDARVITFPEPRCASNSPCTWYASKSHHRALMPARPSKTGVRGHKRGVKKSTGTMHLILKYMVGTRRLELLTSTVSR